MAGLTEFYCRSRLVTGPNSNGWTIPLTAAFRLAIPRLCTIMGTRIRKWNKEFESREIAKMNAIKLTGNTVISVADPDPGSSIRDPVPLWPLDPGFGIRNRFFPSPYFWELIDNFLGKKFFEENWPKFILLQHFKTKIITILWNLWLQKKVWQLIFLPPSFVAVFWSGIRDPGSGMGKNKDPG